MLISKINPRLAVVVLMAFSVSLPVAALSLCKVLLFVTGLCFLVKEALVSSPNNSIPKGLTTPMILIGIGLWSFSLYWTAAAQDDALVAFVKHGKLLGIPIILFLVRDRKEITTGLQALATGQCLVMVSSWLMAFDISLPWVFRPSGSADPLTQFVPYADSYLDQSIMLAATAGIFWHLVRHETRSIYKSMCMLFVFGCILNVLALMPGRTGYLLAIATACLAAIFEVPRRLRIAVAMFSPLVLGITLFYTVPQFQQRIKLATEEMSSYGTSPVVGSSIGARLNMWKLSASAIASNPIPGYGIGNWTPVVKKLYGSHSEIVFGSGNLSNPHQELLLWTVELGLVGAALYFGIFWALLRDTQNFATPIRRANLSLITMLFLTCLFNSPLYDDLMGDYFCIAIGLLLALGSRGVSTLDPARAKSSIKI